MTSFIANATDQIKGGAAAACVSACNTSSTVASIFGGIANALLFLVGAVSVLMIILGGIKYVMSMGDSKSVESAKNTVLYAVIGVVVALISFALVQFVTTHIK